jgi:hypothetical protein
LQNGAPSPTKVNDLTKPADLAILHRAIVNGDVPKHICDQISAGSKGVARAGGEDGRGRRDGSVEPPRGASPRGAAFPPVHAARCGRIALTRTRTPIAITSEIFTLDLRPSR